MGPSAFCRTGIWIPLLWQNSPREPRSNWVPHHMLMDVSGCKSQCRMAPLDTCSVPWLAAIRVSAPLNPFLLRREAGRRVTL